MVIVQAPRALGSRGSQLIKRMPLHAHSAGPWRVYGE
jgi:hypothetical protein